MLVSIKNIADFTDTIDRLWQPIFVEVQFKDIKYKGPIIVFSKDIVKYIVNDTIVSFYRPDFVGMDIKKVKLIVKQKILKVIK